MATSVISAPKAASILKRDASERAIDADTVTFRTKIRRRAAVALGVSLGRFENPRN